MKNEKSKSSLKTIVLLLIVLAVAGAATAFVFARLKAGKAGTSNSKLGLFTVQRGDLTISVTENGDIKALKSKDIMSEVEGRTTIISIVDEGTYIKPEDVNKMVLVELDSSRIKDKLTVQKIKFLTSEASYTEARESLDIQEQQNESDIQTGQMDVRFALMDLQKYLSRTVAEKLVSSITKSQAVNIQVEGLINDPNLGGEALQELRKLSSDIQLTAAKLAKAKDKLKGSKQLYDKNYIAEIELMSDRLDVNSLEIQQEQANTAKDLFIQYEFPKQSEKLLSDYDEAKRELERTKARARSKLAQAKAKLGSSEATFLVEKELLEKWRKQLKACTIIAPSPGEVVYSSTTNRWARRRGRIIEVGGEVRERQKIISIPDTSTMKVEIKVHETWIDKIQLGQQAKITIAAFPDKTFTGKVLKKAPMADPEEWMNPDLKVYSTDVSIEGTHDFLKTGMTGKVEVIIEELKDVINVPIQSVIGRAGRTICFVAKDKGIEQREVETGVFNNNFVEIKSGLSEGEKVMLNPPRLTEFKPRK